MTKTTASDSYEEVNTFGILRRILFNRYLKINILIFVSLVADIWFGSYYVNQLVIKSSPKGGMLLNIFLDGSINPELFLKILIVVSSLSWAAFSIIVSSRSNVAFLPIAVKCIFYSAPFFWGHSLMQEW